jgi:hypothetical protein
LAELANRLTGKLVYVPHLPVFNTTGKCRTYSFDNLLVAKIPPTGII